MRRRKQYDHYFWRPETYCQYGVVGTMVLQTLFLLYALLVAIIGGRPERRENLQSTTQTCQG
jgi:hypothetical protein